MKRLIIFSLALLVTSSAFAQSTIYRQTELIGDRTQEKGISSLALTSQLETESLQTQASYLLGVYFGSIMRNSGLGAEMDFSQIVAGMKDFFTSENGSGSDSSDEQYDFDPDGIPSVINQYANLRQMREIGAFLDYLFFGIKSLDDGTFIQSGSSGSFGLCAECSTNILIWNPQRAVPIER